MSNKNGQSLQEPRVLIAQQKHHINTMNRMIWLLVTQAGGEVRVKKEKMSAMPDSWMLDINSDDATGEVVFIAGDKKTVDNPTEEV